MKILINVPPYITVTSSISFGFIQNSENGEQKEIEPEKSVNMPAVKQFKRPTGVVE
jgi:hypothetical protein